MRRNQQAFACGTVAFELAGALWLGNDDEFGHALWQTVDASAVSAMGATGLKAEAAQAFRVRSHIAGGLRDGPTILNPLTKKRSLQIPADQDRLMSFPAEPLLLRGFRCSAAASVVAVALSMVCLSCRAAPEEIQIYLDDMSAPGHFGLDVHNNYVVSGAWAPGYVGELQPRHVYRLTPEFYYGLTSTVELGLYALTTTSPDGGIRFVGSKIRVKYVAPHDAHAGFFWGMNLEAGRTTRAVSETAWNAEIKGILGYRTGQWTIGVNPNFDWSLSSHGGPGTASIDFKVNRALSDNTEVGIESYNELGPASRIQSFSRNSKTLYVVLDQKIGEVDLNIGFGRGLTTESDRWTAKFIVGTHF